ncbi:Cacna2d3 [Symbiodinium natans]|uniref:Cacna2d3 protein n=1 Tax=Symbiodinium natans TaxID=878477 RepID=A0A812RME6_9DINO|nr:Cacna2d3 [Symbiodinium natans]
MSMILTFFVEGDLAWKSVGLHYVEAQEDAQPQQPQAPGAVLDTQDRKDCAAVILFDHVSPQYSGRRTPASDIAVGSTSGCQKVIIFLTNLGSGADTSVAKRRSCENRGILCNVPDGSDLSLIMASYYKYFATGQETCQPSFTRYKDAVTSTRHGPQHDIAGSEWCCTSQCTWCCKVWHRRIREVRRFCTGWLRGHDSDLGPTWWAFWLSARS